MTSSTLHPHRALLALALLSASSFMLSACAGLGTDYSTPAPARQIPFTVEPVTTQLVSTLISVPPDVAAPPANSIPASQYAYRIGPTDVLSIFVNQSLYGDQVAGGSSVDRQAESLYVVSESGYIFLPLHGALKVAGLTVAQAYSEIQKALAKFVTHPQINVRIAEFRSQRIAVAGNVTKPGYAPITDRMMTITEAIMAAGQSGEADLRKVTLKRGGQEYPIDVFALINSPGFGQNWVLQANDVIFVPKNENHVYVLGEAPNRTEYIDAYSTSLAEVLLPGSQRQRAGGGDTNYLQNGAALPGSIFVIRGNLNAVRVFHLNGSSPEAFILADKFQLASGDIVFVSTRPVTRFNRFVAQLLPTLQAVLEPVLIYKSLIK